MIRFRRLADGGLEVTTATGERFLAPIPPVEILDAGVAGDARLERARLTIAFGDLAGPEVDEALGVTEPTVDRWEGGRIVPSLVDVARVARLTGRPLAWFYEPLMPAGTSAIVCVRGGKGRGCYVVNGGPPVGDPPGQMTLGL